MIVRQTAFEGVLIVEPRVFSDARGYFFESFSQRDFDEQVVPLLGHSVDFVQDNESKSYYGVVRGLHFQRPPFAQRKLVRCVQGRVLDVVVDIRPGSPTYGQHESIEISADNKRQVFIDRGFAHGFAVLSEMAVFQYKCDEFYHPEADSGIQLMDPALGIDWCIPAGKMILSDKDHRHPCLADIDFPFEL
ncbi:MAG: dTDP-4-dehydrorhamnose 3,5-epimerase [Bacteroidales bacterium]|nr:dTDP-4-dehydrorhamnose 3,5-epimerase [Bacteroidales bacterium]